MKMFKRFAAALLAGVMVLAMLTACGGAPKSLAQRTEDVVLGMLNYTVQNNKNLSADGELTNDSGLYETLQEVLSHVNTEDDTVDAKYIPKNVYGKMENNTQNVVSYNIVDSNGKVRTVTEADVAQMEDALKKADDAAAQKQLEIKAIKYNKLAVAARTIEGKTYLVTAMDVTYTYGEPAVE